MITLEEAKQQMRFEGNFEDGLILFYIAAAAQHIENVTGKRWGLPAPVVQTMLWQGGPAFLLGAPESDVVIEYRVRDGWEILETSWYWIDGDRVQFDPCLSLSDPATLRLSYTAGVQTGLVPQPVRQACLLLVAHWFENREAAPIQGESVEGYTSGKTMVMPFGVRELLSPYRRTA